MSETVSTEAGVLRGAGEGPVTVFRGIPFAAPPVGLLRFAPPTEVEPWDGVRAATEFGPSPMQNIDPLSMVVPGAERYYYTPSSAQFSEDCLYLNVCTPAADGKKRPVMVWIHGSGFVTGSGSGEWFDGTNLVTKNDVVLVSINYRLGILGYLYLGDFDPSLSNPGLRDQATALRWVRRNIERFGGDPDNVTVFGQSAGGMAVASLMVSPLGVGLFDRAIVQSGNASSFVSKERAQSTTRAVIDALQLGPGDEVEQLREVSTLRLFEVQRTLASRFFPTMDGNSLAIDPLAEVRGGNAANVPLLIGTTAEELKLFHLLGFPVPEDGFDLEGALRGFFGGAPAGVAAEAAQLYRSSSPGGAGQLWDLATSDAGFVLPARDLADAHAAAGRASYLFEFAIKSTAFGGIVGAAHEVDVPFVFDALHKPGVDGLLGTELVSDPAAQSLAAEVGAAWTTFARTGSPASASIGEWPRYEARDRATVILDRVISIENNHNAERLDFMSAHAPSGALFALLGYD